jgi:hypothetical protein
LNKLEKDSNHGYQPKENEKLGREYKPKEG